MARRKRRSSHHGRKPAGHKPETTPPAAAGVCPSCGAALQAEGRFCHACGAALDDATAPGPWNAKTLALAAGFVVAVAAVTVAAGVLITQYKAAERPAAGPGSTASRPEQSIDLSRLSPRHAADQLFNRVMMAREQGDLEAALRFAPMALEAYGQLDRLDDDAQYHLGLIHATTGDLESARTQIAILRQAAPDHLLALVLAHEVAEQAGDFLAAERAAAGFAAAYEAEFATGRPEYDAHRTTIETFRAATAGAAAAPAAPPTEPAASSEPAATAAASEPAGPLPGAALFDKYCARCHGHAAAGGETGPPLVHRIYVPGHHADAAFLLAVRQGVRAHHWSFGDMPPIPGVTEVEVDQISAYVRALQKAAGIE